MRRWLRRLLILFGVLLLIIILLPVGLRLYLSDARIRAAAEARLSQALGRSVTIGEFRMSPLSSIEIDRVTVEDKPEYGGNMMTLGTVRVAYRALSVFGDSIEIPEIRVEDLRLRVVKTAGGTLNVADLPPGPPPPPEAPPPKPAAPLAVPNFTIGRIAVARVSLDYEDRQADRKVSMQDLGLNGTCSAQDNRLSLELAGKVEKPVLQQAGGPARTLPPVTSDLKIGFDAGKNEFDIAQAEVKGDGLRASLAGKGSLAPEEMRLDLKGLVSLDLSGPALTALSGLDGQTGTLKASLVVSGEFSNIAATMAVEGGDLAWPVEMEAGERAMFTLASLSANQTLSGNLEKTVSLEGAAFLRNIGITGKGRKLDSIDAVYEMEADTETRSGRLTRLEIKGPGMALNASGSVDPEVDGARPLHLAAGLSVDFARALEPLVASLRDCRGVLTLKAAARGTSRAPILDLALSLPSFQATRTATGDTFQVEGLEAVEKSSLADDGIHVPVQGVFRVARFSLLPAAGEPQRFEDLAVTHSLVLDASSADVELESFEASLPGLSASASGSLKNVASGNPEVSLAESGTIDFQRVLTWAAPARRDTLDGVLRFQASVSGTRKAPVVSAGLASDRITARQPESGRELTLEKLAFALKTTPQDTGAILVQGDLEPLTARLKQATGEPVEMKDIVLTARMLADLDRQTVRDINLKLKWQDLSAALTGEIHNLAAEPTLDAGLSLNLPLEQAAPLIPGLPWSILGLLRADAKVEGSAADLELGARFTLGELELSDPAQGTTARIAETSATLRSHVVRPSAAELALSARTSPIRVTYQGKTSEFPGARADVSAEADLTAMDLRLPEATLQALGSQLRLQADLKGLSSDDPALESEVSGTIVFPPELAAFVPSAAALSGDPVTLSGKTSGTLSNLELSFQGGTKRLAYRLEGFDPPLALETPLAITAAVSPAADGLLRIAADVKGEPRFLDPAGNEVDRSPLEVSSRATFAPHDRLLRLETLRANALGLAAEVKGQARMTETATAMDLSAAGNLDLAGLAPFVRAFMQLTPAECAATGKAEFSASVSGDSAATAAILSAAADRLELTYSPEEEKGEEAGPEAEGPGEAPAPAPLDLAGTSATATLRIGTLVLNGVPVRNAVLDARSVGNRIELRTLSGELAGGTLDLAGKADTGVPGWDFQITGRAEHVALASLAALANTSRPDAIRGSTSLQLQLAGRGLDMPSLRKNLSGQGQIAMATVEITPRSTLSTLFQVTGLQEFSDTIRFDAFQTDLTVDNGAVMTKDLTLRASDYAATFVGGVGLDGAFRDATLNLLLPSTMASRLPVPGYEGKSPTLEEGGRFNLPIAVAGTLENPKPMVDWKQVGTQLFQRALTDLLQPGEKQEGKDALKGILDIFGRPREKTQ